MLYTHFTEELFELQGIKVTNIEKEEKSISREELQRVKYLKETHTATWILRD